VLHAFVTARAMDLLVCTDVGDDSEGDTNFQSRLVADMDVWCDGSDSGRYGLAIPMLLVYSLGAPVILGIAVLVHNIGTQQSRYHLSYLVANYAPHAPYWETVSMVHKGSLAIMTTALQQSGVSVQIAVGAMIVVVKLFLITEFKPLRTKIENQLEQISSMVLLLSLLPVLALPTAFDGTFQGVSASERNAATATGVAVFVLNLVFVAGTVGSLVFQAMPLEWANQVASYASMCPCKR